MEDSILDVSGLSCPMPLIKVREALLTLQVGQIIKVLCTDRGSIKDFQGWAKSAKNIELIKQETENQAGKDRYIHYIKKVQ